MESSEVADIIKVYGNSLAWAEKNIKGKINSETDAELLQAIEDFERLKKECSVPPSTLEKLAITEMDPMETGTLEESFGIWHGEGRDIWHLADQERITKFARLDDTLRGIDGDATSARLDAILSLTLDDAVGGAEAYRHCMFKNNYRLSVRVKYKGQKRLVYGFANYTLWHDTLDKNDIKLVVNREVRYLDSGLVRPLLGLLGMIHRSRKRAGKKNCAVYGLISDSYIFRFVGIDNSSRITYRTLDWNNGNDDRIQTISLLAKICKEAASLSSPNHTLYQTSP